VFLYREPTLGLTPTEQELLAFALKGYSDEAIADRLSISPAAVKKRWANVFIRFADRQLLPASSNGKADQTRGPQKRHKVLDFLRGHPEELRPVEPAAKARRRR
jgi:hypothetical protein